MVGAASKPAPGAPAAREVAARAIVAVVGGYAATYAITAALSAGLYRAGLSKVDAAIVSTNLALLAYPAVAIWAFARRGLLSAAAVPAAIAVGSGLVAVALSL